MPNSSMFVLPTTRAPRLRSCWTMVASKGEAWEARILEAHCVWKSEVAMLSLTARRMALSVYSAGEGDVDWPDREETYSQTRLVLSCFVLFFYLVSISTIYVFFNYFIIIIITLSSRLLFSSTKRFRVF